MKIPIPSQIKIGTQVFDVKLRDRKDDGMLNDSTFGYTLGTENLIIIDASLKFSKQRVTLVHEILHALFSVFDNSVKPTKKDDFEVWEHYFIGLYEEPLVMIIKDNPELLKYLSQ
jgi:Zn-dependent peptidase ImmA (M78 family)